MAVNPEKIFTKKFTKAEAWNAYQQLLSEKESLDSIEQTVSDALSKGKTLEDRIVKLDAELSVAKNANVLLKRRSLVGRENAVTTINTLVLKMSKLPASLPPFSLTH